MDKALASHAGGQGSNLDKTKDFIAPILSRIPATCTLSRNACYHRLQFEYREYTGDVKSEVLG